MTVNTSYDPIESVGSGIIAPIPITWTFGEATDLSVFEVDIATEAEIPKTLGVHFTVTQSTNGGVVTPLTGIATGKKWRIERSTPLTQPDVLRTAGVFLEGTVEGMIDRVTRITQELDAARQSGDMLLRPNLASNAGATYVSHTQPLTGAVKRLVSAKLSEQISVEDFGAKGDGVTDDTAAIQAAEDAVAAAGGTELLFKSTRYKITGTLYKRTSNILWRGRGEGHQHDVGSGFDAATALVWAGSAGGTMITFAPTTGASARRISGGGIVGIGLYGNDSAAIGLNLLSVNNAKIDIYAENFTNTCVYVGVVATLGEARDAQQNTIRLLFSQVSNATGKAMVLDGDTAANTSCNRIHLRGAHKFATALHMVNCDNNIIYQWTYNFGGSGLGVDSLGGASSGVTARANTWEYIWCGGASGGGVRLRGTSDGYTAASTRNRFLMWDNDNVQPVPVTGTGCDYFMVDHDGAIHWTECSVARVAQNVMDWRGTSTDKIMLRMQWVGTSADSYWEMRNTTAGSVQLQASSDSASNVNINILTKGTGTGALVGGNFSSLPFQWRHNGAAQIGFYGTTPVSKPTVTGSRGGNAALASVLTALAGLGLVTDSSTA